MPACPPAYFLINHQHWPVASYGRALAITKTATADVPLSERQPHDAAANNK